MSTIAFAAHIIALMDIGCESLTLDDAALGTLHVGSRLFGSPAFAAQVVDMWSAIVERHAFDFDGRAGSVVAHHRGSLWWPHDDHLPHRIVVREEWLRENSTGAFYMLIDDPLSRMADAPRLVGEAADSIGGRYLIHQRACDCVLSFDDVSDATLIMMLADGWPAADEDDSGPF